jgi:hypothetical protein
MFSYQWIHQISLLDQGLGCVILKQGGHKDLFLNWEARQNFADLTDVT